MRSKHDSYWRKAFSMRWFGFDLCSPDFVGGAPVMFVHPSLEHDLRHGNQSVSAYTGSVNLVNGVVCADGFPHYVTHKSKDKLKLSVSTNC